MRANLFAGVLTVLIVAQPVLAQQRQPDPAAGHELASKLCTACHIVGTEQAGSDVAPPFPVIAKDPDVTVTELHAWVGSTHPVLPNLALTSRQVADINAYLDTLHDAGVQQPPRVETKEQPPALRPAPPEQLGKPIGPSN